MESLILLAQKQSGKIKARIVANGSTKISYIDSDNAASPTAASDYVIIIVVIEAKQGRDVMINDFSDDFLQTPVPQDKGDERIIMNIQGALVDILCNIRPEIY